MDVKLLKEGFATILESPNRVDFRNFVKDNFGEQDFIDFKKTYIESDKLAKHILAFANSEGGIIVFGIDEIGGEINVAGIDQLKDKADIKSQLEKFLPEHLDFQIFDFQYNESEYNQLKGKCFQLLSVANQSKYVPFLSNANGSNINKNRIYVRRGTKSIEANHVELQKLLNRRIDLNHSTTTEIEFEEHLIQLKTLYGQIKKDFTFSKFGINPFVASMLLEDKEPNKNYPKEGFDEFISKMIKIKKSIIEREVKK